MTPAGFEFNLDSNKWFFPSKGHPAMKIEVDFDKCTGLGICESLAPDFFEIDDNGDLLLLKEDVTDEELQSVEESVAGCPTEALRILRG